MVTVDGAGLHITDTDRSPVAWLCAMYLASCVDCARLVQIHPNKFLGVLGEHSDYPIERIKVRQAVAAPWLRWLYPAFVIVVLDTLVRVLVRMRRC